MSAQCGVISVSPSADPADGEGSRIMALTSYSVPLCSLAQMRRLASVASPNTPLVTQQARRSRSVQELVICLVCPLLFIPLVYIVQGHRYDIMETLGCGLADYLTWPTVVLRYIVPVVISLLSLTYSCESPLSMSFSLIRRHRREMVYCPSKGVPRCPVRLGAYNRPVSSPAGSGCVRQRSGGIHLSFHLNRPSRLLRRTNQAIQKLGGCSPRFQPHLPIS